MSANQRSKGAFTRLLRGIRLRFGGAADDHATASENSKRVDTVPVSTDADDLNLQVPAAHPSASPSASALINEGLLQRQHSGTAAARPYFEKAAELWPNSYVPWLMLGNVASELGEVDVAVTYYSNARDLNLADPIIRYNLGLNHFLRGDVRAAIEELRAACSLNPFYPQAQATYLMALHNSDLVDPNEIAMATREWGARFSREYPSSLKSMSGQQPDDSKPLRVGFVSGDFRTHSVAHFFEPVLSSRQRDMSIYVLYSNSQLKDAVTERLRGAADFWRDVWELSDDALVEMVRNDQIDILVDLSGHTASNRLAVFARRAAPVQITYLGYPSSTGLATMDYRIADGATDPPVPADDWHSERLLRMPDTQWCFRPVEVLATASQPPALEAGFVTFGSFNNLTKASDTLLNCWAKILIKLSTARLRLTRVRSASRAVEIIAFFERRGVGPERIECVPFAINPPYGQQFAGVDIALDNYPYNGVTTTCESLYLGVPVVSLHGRNGVSRSGLSLLGAIGLIELVASTPDQYVDIALSLANDLERLERLRGSLRARFEQSSLRDEKRFSANFEKLLRDAWSHHFELNANPPSAAGH